MSELAAALLYALAWTVARLPWPLLRLLADGVARLSIATDGREARVTRRNLELIRPDLDAAARERLVRDIVRTTARQTFETMRLWTRPAARNLADIAEVRGEALFDAALADPRGLVVGSYDGEPVSYWQTHQGFLGAGAALRMRGSGRAIYAVNHFDLPKHFPAFSDINGFGYVQTRWDEGDSVATIVANFPKWFQPLSAADFQTALADDFPFLQGADLGFVQRKGAA